MIGDPVLVTLAAVLAVPLTGYCAEVFTGTLPARRWQPAPGPVTLAVLMPAHNEAKVIAAAVAATRAALRPEDRLLVVADNCSDDTAAQARAAGAEVVERFDPGNRGKGFALAHGVARLAEAPPDCVVILDADCAPTPGALERIARIATARGRAVQACYLFRPDPLAGPVTRISNFAFMLKNRVRQRGMMRLGGTCVLTGSGMAFPWPQIAAADLANGEIVEDLVLGLRLAMDGLPPVYDDRAVVFSEGAPSDEETIKQRRRWEHGFVATALRFVPSLLQPRARAGARARLWTAWHLTVPPFMLLLALALMLAGLAGLAAVSGLASHGLALGVAALAIAPVAATLLAWLIAGRAYLGLGDLLRLPGYLLAKLGIWRGFVTAREKSWAKTER